MEQILEQLPEDVPITIQRIHSSRQRNKTTQLWVVEVGSHKTSNHDLMTALKMAKDKCNGQCSR